LYLDPAGRPSRTLAAAPPRCFFPSVRRLRFLLLSLFLSACGGGNPPPDHPHGHEGKGPLVHRFEKADEWAKVFDEPTRDQWQRPSSVIAVMKISAGMTVADLGAGTGYFLPHLSKAVGPTGKVLGLDVEPDMVRYMKERATRDHLDNVTALVVAGDDPGLAKASVDRILVVDTWHHVPERTAYATKLKGALAPSGALFIVDFTLESSHGPPKHHRIAPEKVVEELKSGGFAAEIVSTDLPEQYVVMGH
jgi:SAM-dependent methyltransferase